MQIESKASLVAQLEQLISKYDLTMHAHADSQMHQYFQQYDISLTEAHVLAYIGDHEKTNATAISNALHITRSGISKITARLVKKNFIQIQYAENSKKTLSYTLSPLGKEIYFVHADAHKQIHTQAENIIARYSEEELTCILRFLTEIAEIL